MSFSDPSAEQVPGEQIVRRRDLREPSTRRSRRNARSRAEAARRASRPTSLGPRSRANRKPPKKSLGRRITTTLFSVLALAFAAGLIVATSVPSSLFAQSAAATTTKHSKRTVTYTDEEGQTMTVAAGTDTSVSRDKFAATSVTAYGHIESLAANAGYTVDNSGDIRWPFDTPVPLGDPFGPRIPPCAGCSSFHNGTDFETGDKASVYAVADGIVTQAGVYGDLGYAVTIAHDVNGYVFSTVYGHMTAGSITVAVGQEVTKGTVVGLTGSTGMSTGPHLFFEVDINGSPIDSFAWLKKETAN